MVTAFLNPGLLTGFTIALDGSLTYTGDGGIFHINSNFCVSKSAAGAQDTEWTIRLNAAEQSKFIQQANVSSSGVIEPVAISVSGFITLATNDVVRIVVRPRNNTEAIEVDSMNFCIFSA